MQKSDFAYHLPRALIAQTPSPERGQSRLLCVGETGTRHKRFHDLPGLLSRGDLLVVNDTKVINARLRGRKDSGGSVELLVERIESERMALCQARSSKPLRAGRWVDVAGHRIAALERVEEFHRLRFPVPVVEFLEQFGETPLPPYIERLSEPNDSQRYQTVYAQHPGAVAAPTAGLHFSNSIFSELGKAGVEIAKITLHVGAGTFQSVRASEIRQHRMHAERYAISEDAANRIKTARQRGGRIVAVGTTVVRALESAVGADGGIRAGAAETRLFITPGYPFQIVDALITNFHLPESTLLMLVCAFAGRQRIMAAYAEAVAGGYRFFSYGDAMFTERHADSTGHHDDV